MDRNIYIEYIINAFSNNNLKHLIDKEKANKIFELYTTLVETNKVTNLTAITEEKDAILKHFIDSATVCDHVPVGATVLDVGCGAGFPSLPLAILRPDVSVTSIDSTGKKINFVNSIASVLNLTNIKAICIRAEDFAKAHRESFDVCTSRAVARLNILSELCIPFVKIGGSFVAMKSDRGTEEYTESAKGIETLGCTLAGKQELVLSLEDLSISREIYVFNKEAKTPSLYPRNYSQITKKPL